MTVALAAIRARRGGRQAKGQSHAEVALAMARGLLERIPPDGLPKEAARWRAMVVAGVANMPNIIRKAEEAVHDARSAVDVAQSDASLDTVFEALLKLRTDERVIRLHRATLGLTLVSTWLQTAYEGARQSS